MYHNKDSMARLRPICLLLMLLAGCVTSCSSGTGSPFCYYDGSVQQSAIARSGSLPLERWRVDYTGGTAFRSGATSYTQPPVTRVHLKLQNSGLSTVVICKEVTYNEQEQRPPELEPYYLIDDHGRRYPALGQGWTRQEGEPAWTVGQVLPGRTNEFHLSFAGIPRDVSALTLVMEHVATTTDVQHMWRLPVALPLPPTEEVP
jgi:hypothetical protein